MDIDFDTLGHFDIHWSKGGERALRVRETAMFQGHAERRGSRYLKCSANGVNFGNEEVKELGTEVQGVSGGEGNWGRAEQAIYAGE